MLKWCDFAPINYGKIRKVSLSFSFWWGTSDRKEMQSEATCFNDKSWHPFKIGSYRIGKMIVSPPARRTKKKPKKKTSKAGIGNMANDLFFAHAHTIVLMPIWFMIIIIFQQVNQLLSTPYRLPIYSMQHVRALECTLTSIYQMYDDGFCSPLIVFLLSVCCFSCQVPFVIAYNVLYEHKIPPAIPQ